MVLSEVGGCRSILENNFLFEDYRRSSARSLYKEGRGNDHRNEVGFCEVHCFLRVDLQSLDNALKIHSILCPAQLSPESRLDRYVSSNN